MGGAPRATSAVSIDPSGDTVLTFTSVGGAGQFWLELEEPLDPVTGTLEWTWRVDEPVEGARLVDPDLDDSPARLFVVFGRGGLFSAPRTLFYSWAGSASDPEFHRSHVNDAFGVVVTRTGGDAIGEWLHESRDLAVDYERAFGEPPDRRVTAVGFMIDSDQTGSRARSALASLDWVTESGDPVPSRR